MGIVRKIGKHSPSASPSIFQEFNEAGTRVLPEIFAATRIELIDEESYENGFAFNVRQGGSNGKIAVNIDSKSASHVRWFALKIFKAVSQNYFINHAHQCGHIGVVLASIEQ